MTSEEVAKLLAEQKEEQRKKQQEMLKKIDKRQLPATPEEDEPRYDRTAASMRRAFGTEKDPNKKSSFEKLMNVFSRK